MLKKPYFIWQKLLIFSCLWSLNELLNLVLFNIQKIRGSNSHAVFLSQKELSGTPTSPSINTFLWILSHVKIIPFSTKLRPRFSKKNLVLILFVFQYLLKNTLWLGIIEITKSALMFIISKIADTLFLVTKFLCLAKNFKSIV